MTEITRETFYSHFGHDSRMRRSAVIDFMQDCCTISRRNDKAIGQMMMSGEALLYVAYRQTDFFSEPQYREALTVRTQLFECKRVYGRRCTLITGGDGRLCAASYLVSTLVSAETRRPLTLPKELNDSIEVSPAPGELELTSRRIAVPDSEPLPCREFTAMLCQADTNGHINNARYVDIGDELIPKGAAVKRLRCEYKASFMPGDRILPLLYHTETGAVITLSNERGELCCIMEYVFGNDAHLLADMR